MGDGMSKLVKFQDGTYGVRAYWFFGWRFKDLRSPGFTWHASSVFFSDCKGTRDEAIAAMSKYTIETP